jgi:hypothetical protein
MTVFMAKYLLPLLFSGLLIIKPEFFVTFLRYIYCQLSGDATMTPEKATKKMFFTRNPHFFRLSGCLLLILLIYKFVLEIKGLAT